MSIKQTKKVKTQKKKKKKMLKKDLKKSLFGLIASKSESEKPI